MNSLFEFDLSFNSPVIGTDEAGRGPGAGDVFGAAVCFKPEAKDYPILAQLNDSKKLSPKLREELAEIIKKCSYYSIKQVGVKEIEKINILNAALRTMKLSCEEVAAQVTKPLILVDGNRKIKDFALPQQTITKGDSKSAAIAAASILAKVARDNYMQELHEKHPEYNWAKNKGYLTREHTEAIKNCGVTKFHRKSFLSKILDL